jgi:hypothetical protein
MVCPPITASFYEELKGWQGAIGSGFGFAALIIGALFNFRLNRRRDDLLRKDEALSVAAALYGEILLLRREAARLAVAVARVHLDVGMHRDPIVKFDSHFFEAHVLSEPTLYKALAPKLGLLPSNLILAITEFHKNIQEARTWLPLMADNPERKYTYGPLYVLTPARDAVREIVPALREIERMAMIAVPAPETLEMGESEMVIDIEEENWSTPPEPDRS